MTRLCDLPIPDQFECWQAIRIHQLENGYETTDACFVLTAYFGRPLCEVEGEEGEG